MRSPGRFVLVNCSAFNTSAHISCLVSLNFHQCFLACSNDSLFLLSPLEYKTNGSVMCGVCEVSIATMLVCTVWGHTSTVSLICYVISRLLSEKTPAIQRSIVLRICGVSSSFVCYF